MNLAQEFNLWVSFHYYFKSINIAFRFLDAGCDNEKLWCEWHVKYRFGKEAPPDDVYFDKNVEKRRSVELLIAKPEISAQAEIMYNAWEFHKKRLTKLDEPPPVIIFPPDPEPKPLPKPKPVPLPEPVPAPKNPNPNLVKFSVYFGLIAAAATTAAFFYPPLKPIVALIVPLIKALLAALGV